MSVAIRYSNDRLEGRSWPARDDLKWQCPECGANRAKTVFPRGGHCFAGGHITPGVAVEYTDGSYETREVECNGCQKRYGITIEMSGDVRIDHNDVPIELWNKHAPAG